MKRDDLGKEFEDFCKGMDKRIKALEREDFEYTEYAIGLKKLGLPHHNFWEWKKLRKEGKL